MIATLDVDAAKAPLILGITGHRDLRPQDIKPLTERVTQRMRELRAKYPATPFILLSPLAEGADRLVARVALLPEMKTRLVVPLPMAADLYENDFPDSKDEFHELLNRASASFVVSPSYDARAVAADQALRDERYDAVGKYVVRQCQILFALWDGVASDKRGSPSSVVDFQIHGMPEQLGSLQPPERFPVYHIITPRESRPSPAGDPFEIVDIYPPTAEPQEAAPYYAKIFGYLEEFNKEIDQGGSSLVQKAMESALDLVGQRCGIVLTREEELGLMRYAMADALAMKFQKRVTHTHWFLFLSVLLSVGCFVLFAHWPSHASAFLVLSLVLFLVGWSIQRRARRLQLDNKSQDYRAMAEGCRVAFFWRLAGIVKSVSDSYFGNQRTVLDWIRAGLRDWDVNFQGVEPVRPKVEVVRLRFVLRHWVDGQRNYFRKTATLQHDNLRFWDLLATLSLKGAVISALVVLAAAVAVQAFNGEWWMCSKCEDWLFVPIIAIDMLLAFGALTHHSIQRQALAQHNRQYLRMRVVFRRALSLVYKCLPADAEAARKYLIDLGRIALQENDDWVTLHRDRPLELPHP